MSDFARRVEGVIAPLFRVDDLHVNTNEQGAHTTAAPVRQELAEQLECTGHDSFLTEAAR